MVLTDKKHKTGVEALKAMVSQLADQYGSKNKPLALYNRLISTMDPEKETDHLDKWAAFLLKNAAVLEDTSIDIKDVGEFKFRYNSKIYINFKHILSAEKSKSVRKTIWDHLLTVNAILDESGVGKELLTKRRENQMTMSKGDEKNFVSDAVDEITRTMEETEIDDENPMATIMSLVSSPMFTKLVTNMKGKVEDGDLDIGSLMSTVTGMMANLESANNKTLPEIQSSTPPALPEIQSSTNAPDTF